MLRRSGLFDPSVALWRPVWLRAGGWLVRMLGRLALLLATLWGTLALYYELSTFLALLFGVVNGVLLFVARPRWIALAVLGVTLAAVMAWWSTIRPSNERAWEPASARTPTATVEGDRITIHDLRDFEYRDATNFTPRYREASYQLSELRTLDLFVSRWGTPLVAHTMLSFGFAKGEFLCVSIETRREVGEDYSAVKSFFRQYELLYVAAVERDVIRSRANLFGEKVWLYRLTTPLPVIRETLLGCLEDMNEVAARPRFFNALTSNCTNTIRRHTRLFAGSSPRSWKLMLNGFVDELAYASGALDQSRPFADLKARSLITAASRAADRASDYSARIRQGRPGFP